MELKNMLKLNVGTGPIWRKTGWTSIDHKKSKVDEGALVGEAHKIPVQSESCFTLFCSHVIEHIPQYRLEETLVEFNRVLQKDGLIRILTPDLYKITKGYVEKDYKYLEKLREESGKVRTDLGYGGTLMNMIVSPGQDSALFSSDLTEFVGGYAHVYLYDFEMLKILLERYGFCEIKERGFCESELKDYHEPLHVEGMEPVWQNLNQEFYQKHNLIHRYDKTKKKYETNFVLTGFDRSPMMSLIVEAKKSHNVDKVEIKDDYNYSYSRSLLDDEVFALKCDMFSQISKLLDNRLLDKL